MSAARSSLRPRRWGSHRLGPRWADRIVGSAQVGSGDLVLDLGAGAGALTRSLAAHGARVVAVELHAGRARQLRAVARSVPDVTVLEQDVLVVALPSRPFRVVANPPYAVAAALVRRLTARGSHLVRADLVLPRWQVRRYVADPPRGFRAELGQHVPASAFRPAPRDDSAVLVLRRQARPGARSGRRTKRHR
ncbi:MAG: methyltransferase domain-containing protein [Actinomycetota bacterium]|nr:methyltransferase domain-containing protein [Actinomycetota bacterium]